MTGTFLARAGVAVGFMAVVAAFAAAQQPCPTCPTHGTNRAACQGKDCGPGGLKIYPLSEKRYISQFCGPTICPGSCFGHFKTQWTRWNDACPNWCDTPTDGHVSGPAPRTDAIPPAQPQLPMKAHGNPLPAPAPAPKSADPLPLETPKTLPSPQPLKDPLELPKIPSATPPKAPLDGKTSAPLPPTIPGLPTVPGLTLPPIPDLPASAPSIEPSRLPVTPIRY